MWRISRAFAGFLCVGLGALVTSPSLLAQDNDSILKNLHKVSTIASTVPSNQDVNPYGVALVQPTIGNLTEGHVLISNLNNFSNLQGTGTTIVEIAPNGSLRLFAGGSGLIANRRRDAGASEVRSSCGAAAKQVI